MPHTLQVILISWKKQSQYIEIQKNSASAESPKIVLEKSVFFDEILPSSLKIIMASNVREIC